MKRMVLTIDRGGWVNGAVLKAVPGADSALLDSQSGLQCCLGFGMRKCGASSASITNIGRPTMATSDDVEGTELFESLQAMEDSAITINDNKSLRPAGREQLLRALFHKYDITLRFTGSTRTAIARAKKAYA